MFVLILITYNTDKPLWPLDQEFVMELNHIPTTLKKKHFLSINHAK